jgi:DNA helicase-2/ATP-dependent DNA helicase PcrA
MKLNPEQRRAAIEYEGNVVVTACPGSGKTRVLTARVMRGLLELKSPKERVIALTFTNRAADEIRFRIDSENIDTDRLWAGTIHAFALEWILRPYAPYSEQTKLGFSVADEFVTERLLRELIREAGLSAYTEINTALDRAGEGRHSTNDKRSIFATYKARLRSAKLLDYDDVLYVAYRILVTNPEISSTLASIIRIVCVDEVQDIQDVQYGILSSIFRAATSPPILFFVGDSNQSIYESLGALTKSPPEIAAEFGLDEIGHLNLNGNYRSTQRIVDLYCQFRPDVPDIESRTDYCHESGVITFRNQTIAREELSTLIATLIQASIDAGVAPEEICVIAPQWQHVLPLARRLVVALPMVDFDAPGLSPLHSLRDNIWFKLCRLFLSAPSPTRLRTRMGWAKEILLAFRAAQGELPESAGTPRRVLRLVNGITSAETDGISYLREVFQEWLRLTGISLEYHSALKDSFDVFFDKAESRIASSDGAMPTDTSSFKRFFNHPSGVVVNTCHGVKGEEYDSVIAFGLLRGYVPHWSAIFDEGDAVASERESKLLYVVCSRAKRRLHLIAEAGRRTKNGNPYETSYLLRQVRFGFDPS